MRRNNLILGMMVSGLALAGLTQSCVSDLPFATGNGEGTLRMQLVVNSDITRAEAEENLDRLNSECVVYISGREGLLHRYVGTSNIPQIINLRSGNYTVEAWTGDSVPASFTSRFYRGYQNFTIEDGSSKQLVLECKIANVVVSVDTTTIQPDIMKEWSVKVFNSTGELLFEEGKAADRKGYFMMSSRDIKYAEDGVTPMRDADNWSYYTNLQYTVEGTKADGSHFSKTGIIESPTLKNGIVEHAHEYVLGFEYNPEYDEQGGGFITIKVIDNEITVEQEIGLYSRPSIKGVGFDLNRRIRANASTFDCERVVRVAGFKGIKSLQLEMSDAAKMNLPTSRYDLMAIEEDAEKELNSLGITWDYVYKDDPDKASTCMVHFSQDFLNNLPDNDADYVINFIVEDGNTRVNGDVSMRVFVTEGPVIEELPVTLVDPATSGNLLDLRARRVTLTGTIDTDEDFQPEIQYRKADSNEVWKTVTPQITRAGVRFSATINNLTPGTKYEYKAVSGERETELAYFTTEPEFVIPNSSMEQWGTYQFKNPLSTKTVTFPGTGSAPSFWSSGNAGSSMGGITLTDKSTDMVNSGTYSARLHSQSAMNMLAAGNLFAGDFLRMPTLTTAEVQFGRPFDGNSHPDALSVWVNYRPAQVTSEGQGLTKQMKDHGQIFVAFATAPQIVNTNDKKYFNENSPEILGYSQVTWEGEDFGEDGKLKEIVLDIEWREGAKTQKPAYIIIVCAASKYGDFFVGAKDSKMYVDDFKLIYNEE